MLLEASYLTTHYQHLPRAFFHGLHVSFKNFHKAPQPEGAGLETTLGGVREALQVAFCFSSLRLQVMPACCCRRRSQEFNANNDNKGDHFLESSKHSFYLLKYVLVNENSLSTHINFGHVFLLLAAAVFLHSSDELGRSEGNPTWLSGTS